MRSFFIVANKMDIRKKTGAADLVQLGKPVHCEDYVMTTMEGILDIPNIFGEVTFN